MMLENIFFLMLETSFYGSIIGIVILLLKALFTKVLSAKWQYLIWMVLILKLIIPFGPQSGISIFNALPRSVITVREEAPQINELYDAQTETVQTNGPTATDHSKNITPYSMLASGIWISGAVIIFMWLIYTNLLLRYRLHKRGRRASDRATGILESCKAQLKITGKIELITQDIISAPSLFGIFKPKILTTPSFENMSDGQIKYTFLHELSHYKRKDVLVNYLLLLLQCIHWFNPIILYCFKKIRRDMEIATDEHTLLCIESTEYKAYGMTLIATLEGFARNIFTPRLLGMAGGAKDMEKRIKTISRFKKPKLIWSIIAVLIISTVSIFCLTDAKTIDTLPNPDEKNIFVNVIPEKTSAPDNTKTAEKNNTAAPSDEKVPTSTPEPSPAAATVPSPTPVPASTDTKEPDTEDTSYNTISVTYDESVGELDLNQVLIFSGNKPIAPGDAALDSYCKLVDYSFDTAEVYKFTVYPDVHGNIALYFDSQFPTVVANISISESDAPESGTACMLPTDPQKIYYFSDLNPDKKYNIEISGYCPGNYNICGKILIY